MKTLKSLFLKFAILYAVGALISAAGGILIQKVSINVFLHPDTLFLQLLPLAGILSAFIAPDFILNGFGILYRKIQRNHKGMLILSITAAFMSLVWVNRLVLLSFMNSADENSCFFLAQLLQAGKWYGIPHPLREFFETAHIGSIHGKWFSVYPPGWPLVWAAALKLNAGDLINPGLTALSLVFLYDIAGKIYTRTVFFPAAAFLLLSPFFLMTGAAYYSHNLCLFLMLAFWSCFIRMDENPGFRWAALAGLILGCAFATRYLTAAALGFLPSGYLALRAFKERGKRLPLFVIFSFTFFVLIAFQMAFNQMITGRWFDPPNHYLNSHEKLGFIAGYPPSMALQYLWQRFFYLLDWTPPGLVLLFLGACLLWKSSSLKELLFRASIFLLPLAFALYYSWGGNQYGPRYLFEAYPMLALSACAFLAHLAKTGGLFAKKASALFLVFCILASWPGLGRHLKYFHKVTFERKAAYIAAERQTQKPALVFVSGFFGGMDLPMAQEDLVRNSPWLNTPIVYALDRGAENSKLVPFFPDRHYYRLTYDRINSLAKVEQLEF